MTDNPVLDVAIGLMGMFLCLSLVCTVINELIATFFKLRASTLSNGLDRLMDVNSLRTAFERHGLVQSAHAVAGGKASYLAGEDFAMALLGSLNTVEPPTFATIQAAISSLPASRIRDALSAHVLAANGRLDELRTRIGSWFDQSMDRVSGVYKRKMKLIGLIVGAIVVLSFNADAIHVYQLLWHDGSLRAAAVARASDLVETTAGGDHQCPNSGLGAPGHAVTVKQLTDIESCLRPLPIGWTRSELDGKSFRQWALGATSWQLTVKILGLLVTVLAVSLGAPFWFDLLSKVANIRGTGAKPARTESS